MTLSIRLPVEPNQTIDYQLSDALSVVVSPQPFHSRIAFAAAHVVPVSGGAEMSDSVLQRQQRVNLDWDRTLAYRHHLWSLGFAVAEAMDTSQRGMGLDWQAAQELIHRSIREAAAVQGKIACGAGTDHLPPSPQLTLQQVITAYEEQVGFVEGCGGQVIMMASRALAACARDAHDYAEVYGRILEQVQRPVIIHWLGEMFDPQLAGYWGSSDLPLAMESCLRILRAHASKIDGIKISLLDKQYEIELRRALPHGMKMYTGDDFHYPELILGDSHGFSHALLGIFDAIAPIAAAALQALDRDDSQGFLKLIEPTVPLSRHIFETPTFHYKTGIVFLAWLNGHQPEFKMISNQETSRSIHHLARLFLLADQARLLRDPELAVARMKQFLRG
ncbi:MAG: dihydrodipicolinate synthase family protein [Planctomycetota bacterium]